jgi:hypothetical protein
MTAHLMLGWAGVVGLAALVTSDLLLVWSPQCKLDVFRAAADKTDTRIVRGAVLGVFSIPLVLATIAYLWQGLERVGPPWLAGALVPAGGNLATLTFLLVSLVTL